MGNSLWGDEFIAEESPDKKQNILNKLSSPKKKSSQLSIYETLDNIRRNVYRILGSYKEQTEVIASRERLHEYITAGIENGIIAIDTETNNSLDPITCKLMGPCLYTPGQKNAYIPINHVDLHTGERLSWQLTEEDVREEFERLTNTKILMHNGKFDYQVIKCTTGTQLKIYWDTLIAVRILDENEKSAGLKQQYIAKIDPSIEKYSIEHLFEGIEYAIVPPELFALYAATDAFMTYKLYEWQKSRFEIKDNERLFQLFLDVEMPIVEVAAEMELTGVELDKEYASRLSAKYHKKLDAVKAKIDEQLASYSNVIAKWRNTEEANFHPKSKKPDKNGEFKLMKSKNEQLKDPPELSSPTQFAILLYDVLKLPVVDKKNPRSTGEDVLKKMDNPLCELVLEQRGIDKLLGTYIDKLPACVSEKTGRLHAHFNQMGTETGRFSSSDPNLQNIPSHEKSIRMMFKATDGYKMVGSDFSQQEPRLLSGYSQDSNMINAYKQGKDLYATIASSIYHNEYRLNLEYETNPDGTPVLDEKGETILFPEGKKRRSSVKGLLLGIMYGMGPASLAATIKGTIKEAQKIIDDFYREFPKVKKWIEDTNNFAKTNGYVEDMWGRRRRLPDIRMKKYEFITPGHTSLPFNPILNTLSLVTRESDPKILKYRKLLDECSNFRDAERVIKDADREGLTIIDNSGYISRAERQCVNARVQGGAATMSKRAMIRVHHDDELKRLGFRLMLAVHDELIGECPEENADKVANRLCDIMKVAALPECTVPFKCDPTIETVWYETDYSGAIRGQFAKLTETMSEEEALRVIYNDRSECTMAQINSMLGISN